MSRHRGYCFTINNYTVSDIFGSHQMMKKAKYGIVGKEIGDETLTPHLQGYILFENAVSFDYVKKFIPRAHIEVSNGTPQQNKEYCCKQDDYQEWGEMPEGQGKRNDINLIATKIRNGEITIEDVMFDYPDIYLKYSRSLEKMFNAVYKPRVTPPEVHWRWGKAGTGKTRFVIDEYGSENVYIKDNTIWWDGYKQQKVILIDDFDNNIPYRVLLRILDRYQYLGQMKGSYIQINSPYIYITCEYPPEHYWSGNEYSQIFRRLTSVKEII